MITFVNMRNSLNLEQKLAEWIYQWLLEMGITEEKALWVKLGVLMGVLIILVWVIAFVSRRIVQSSIRAYSERVNRPLLNVLVENQTFKYLTRLIPLIFAMISMPIVLHGFDNIVDPAQTIIGLLMILTVNQFIQSVLKFVKVVLLNSDALKDKPIAAYVQVGSIVVNILSLLIAISLLTDRSILSLLTAVGAMSAALLLIFKDTLAGLAASVRISSSDMLRNGDWIEFSKYGADGTVMDINLVSVKVRNFDNTYTTVPTSAFTADAFKNWRGMEESDGRRIKRSVTISQHSVQFASSEMIEKFQKHPLLSDYIIEKLTEINRHNEKVQKEGKGVARSLTNLGLFRVYLRNYLAERADINKDMTLLVRQLSPSENGVPMEIYCFSKIKAWVDFENIQSDIFDHVFASVKDFNLEIFENPSDKSFSRLIKMSEDSES
jgi:miniconductance mechanosensitive channel